MGKHLSCAALLQWIHFILSPYSNGSSLQMKHCELLYISDSIYIIYFYRKLIEDILYTIYRGSTCDPPLS